MAGLENQSDTRRRILIDLILIAAGLFIIAIILYPVFAPAINKPPALRSCKSNVRQQVIAVLIYMQDHGENSHPTTRSGKKCLYRQEY